MSIRTAITLAMTLVSASTAAEKAAQPAASSAELEIDDPRILEATNLKRLILEQEESLRKQQEEVFRATEASLKRFDPTTLEHAQTTLDGFRQLTRTLHLIGDDLLLRHSQLQESLTTHQVTLASGTQVYEEAAQAAREWAKDARYQATKADYLLMAECWEVIAARLSENAQLLDQHDKELRESIDYLKETMLFLKRLYAHLSTLFNLETEAERQRYLESLRSYIQSFRKFESLFRDFHQKLTDHALNSNVPENLLRDQGLNTQLAYLPTRSEELPLAFVSSTLTHLPYSGRSVASHALHPLRFPLALSLSLALIASVRVARGSRRNGTRRPNSSTAGPVPPMSPASDAEWLTITNSGRHCGTIPVVDGLAAAYGKIVPFFYPNGKKAGELRIEEISDEQRCFVRRFHGNRVRSGYRIRKTDVTA